MRADANGVRVLEDDVRLSASIGLISAVKTIHPVFNDLLRTMALGANVCVGAGSIFAHRSSEKLWDITIPEHLWLMWNESTIISFYDDLSNETRKALDQAHDEWVDGVGLAGVSSPETFELIEEALVERVRREQGGRDAFLV